MGGLTCSNMSILERSSVSQDKRVVDLDMCLASRSLVSRLLSSFIYWGGGIRPFSTMLGYGGFEPCKMVPWIGV